MAFKADKTSNTNWTRATTYQQTSTSTNAGKSKADDFKINTKSISTKGVVPDGMTTMFGEIGEALGVDLLDLSKLTPEQVTEAKKRAASLDEKLIAMKELAPAVMKFLSFQVNVAEFQAELVVQSLKAKSKIDQAQAKAYVAYFRYLRKAQNLEKRVKQQQSIIDAAYNAFESVQDARHNAILSGLNQQARLGIDNASHADNLKQQRQQILADRREKLQEMKHNLKTAHLSNQ